MEIISSYSVRIKEYSHIFDDTIHIYRQAVSYLIQVLDLEWNTIKDLSGKNKNNYIEKLIHKTSKNKAKYDFDHKFYKFPSYLRRTALQAALGAYSSYRSNLENWELTDKSTKKPKLTIDRNVMPVFYKGNMFEHISDYKANIKIYHKNDWTWIPVDFRKSDVDYIKHHFPDKKLSNPTIIKKGKRYSLRFAIKEYKELSTVPVDDQIIVSVDLGINNSAVCTAMISNGTVINRKFISCSREEDRLNHAINRIKKYQKLGNRPKKAWIFANNINRHIAETTADEIVKFAINNYADVIVFEYLDLKGKKNGSKKQRLALWKARRVQELVTHKAHRSGIRISRVNAKNTSKLANSL